MTAPRFPLPAAYLDSAFSVCLSEAIKTPELVQQFDRLYGTTASSRSPSREDMAAFCRFVHRCIYMTLPSEAIEALRGRMQGGTDETAKPPELPDQCASPTVEAPTP